MIEYITRIENKEIICLAKHNNKTIGSCCGKVYESGSFKRNGYGTCADINRNLYIDFICVNDKFKNQGIGTKILNAVESWLKKQHIYGKKNIYVQSIHQAAWWWYRKGYIPVQTYCHNQTDQGGECSICDDGYLDEGRADHVIWMAKPIGKGLDREVSEFELEQNTSKDGTWLILYSQLGLKNEIFEAFKEDFEDINEFKKVLKYPKDVKITERSDYFWKHIAPKFEKKYNEWIEYIPWACNAFEN